MNKNTICFVTSKSGGHLLPCLTQAENYKKNNPHAKVIFFTTNHTLDHTIVKNNSFVDDSIFLSMKTFNKKKWWFYPLYAYQCFAIFAQSFLTLYKVQPDKVISMGGAISIPVCLAAKLLRIPIELFELNAIPGKALSFLVPHATKISYCFKRAELYFKNAREKYLESYPIRFTPNQKISAQEARKKLNLAEKPTLLIVGGSQGSLFINNLIKEWIPKNNIDIQILHQIGINDSIESWQDFYKKFSLKAYVFTFIKNIEVYYCAADLIVCRSGAGTLFEILFFEKPCITIPLISTTTDHQSFNAQEFAQEYPSLVQYVEQKQCVDDPLLFKSLIATFFKKATFQVSLQNLTDNNLCRPS